MRGMYPRMLWAQFGKAAILCLEVISAKGMAGLKGVTVSSSQGSLCLCVMGVHVCTCLWSSEGSFGCRSGGTFYFLLETGSAIGLGLCHIG